MAKTKTRRAGATGLQALAGVCAAELRAARRMLRTWLFATVAFGFGAANYTASSVNHVWLGGAPPRFNLPALGLLTLWILLVGVVFMTFDGRARDETARMAETLDARPVSNIALLAGRLLATTLTVWLPLLVLTAGLQIAGTLMVRLEWPLGSGLEPVSLGIFLLLDAPVALVFWGALVAMLVALLRSRWIGAALAAALLALNFYVIFNIPMYLLPALSGVTNLGLPGSEILPRGASSVDVAARLATLVVAGGLLAVAAGVLPRRDQTPRLRHLAIGCGLAATGTAAIVALAWQAQAAHDERLGWAQTHRELSGEARLDVERLTGRVGIEPGRRLSIQVEVTATAPEATALDTLRFSLNPAMRVASVAVDGTALPHSHRHGLLTVTPPEPLAAKQRVRVAIEAHGIPDARFGYLDSAVDAMGETLLGYPIVLLGDQASLFDESYLALTPSVRWLPAAGANYAAPPDFHELALAVDMPQGWHAAGAGRVPSEAGARFEPGVPIPEFALFAAPLKRLAMSVHGVVCELLIHPKHMGNIDYLAAIGKDEPVDDESAGPTPSSLMVIEVHDGETEPRRTLLDDRARTAAENIRGRLERWLSGEHAPTYPHQVVSMVEVPGQLRRYRGGWLMDTAQAFPGVQLMAEHGFPTSRFTERPRPRELPEEQWLDFLAAQIDYSGPHGIALTVGAPRNLGAFLTRATGEGAAAADHLLEWLTEWRVRGVRENAPAHWLLVGPGQQAPFLWRAVGRAMASSNMASNRYLFFPMRLEDESEAMSRKMAFAAFDPRSVENGADILIHKGNLVALSIQRLLGLEKVARFLALMRERHGGEAFTLEDLAQALIDVDPAIGPFLENVLFRPSLPGFLASDAQVDRLADDETGNPRYQIRVAVRNDEPVPGVAGISYRTGDFGYQWSPFALVPGSSAVEIGVVTREPPAEVRLETYLSLNRRILRLRLPPVDATSIVEEPPLVGSRPSDWRPRALGIVVDDLDPGFATVSPPPGWGQGRTEAADDDRLPEFGRSDDGNGHRWHRQADMNAVIWGKYRRTLARIVAGKGEGQASFTTALPVAGHWRLHYHLPGASFSEDHYMRANSWWERADDFGEMDIRIVVGEGDAKALEVAFDAALASPGWNSLGTWELPAGPVRVVVTDATTGDIVVADAIRWQRLEGV